VDFKENAHEKLVNRLEMLRRRPARKYAGGDKKYVTAEHVQATHQRIISHVEKIKQKSDSAAKLNLFAKQEAFKPELAEFSHDSIRLPHISHDVPVQKETPEQIEMPELLSVSEFPAIKFDPPVDIDIDDEFGITEIEQTILESSGLENSGIKKKTSTAKTAKPVPPKKTETGAQPQEKQNLHKLPKKKHRRVHRGQPLRRNFIILPFIKRKPAKPQKIKPAKHKSKSFQKDLADVSIKVKFPITIKLVAIVTVFLLVALGSITFLVSFLVSSDVQLTAEDNNFSINRRTSDAANAGLYSKKAAVSSLLYDIDREILNQEDKDYLIDYFFEYNPDIAAVNTNTDGGTESLLINKNFFKENSLDESLPILWQNSETDAFAKASSGLVLLRNASPVFGINMLVMLLPAEGKTAAVFFEPNNLDSLFHTGANISFLINEDGDVLIHPNPQMVLGGVNLGNTAYIQGILSNSQEIKNVYIDEQGAEYFGTFQRIDSVNTSVITIIKKSFVFGGIQETTRRNIIISLLVLGLSIFLIILFSFTISKPLKSLTYAVSLFEKGNYSLNLKCKNRDEIGVLTDSFIGMGNSLANFEKFTNKAIVKLAKQGKLSRTGEDKTITVCFALIRDFDELSGGLTANALVDLVNEYLEVMVPCITSNSGSIDKFLTQGGVVIMALWGSPESSGSTERDALNCMRAILSMRAALRCLNQKRSKKYGTHMPLIKMGSGINTGRVVAGQMGSEDRMEFTVIGDAVNIAARIEGPNDLFDTDILISEETYNLVKRYIIAEEQQSIEVKGKEKPLRIFSVVNMGDPTESAGMLSDLEKIKGTDFYICKQCVGAAGPGTMEEVRKAWHVSD
jgi:adenylate cyclase